MTDSEQTPAYFPETQKPVSRPTEPPFWNIETRTKNVVSLVYCIELPPDNVPITLADRASADALRDFLTRHFPNGEANTKKRE